jgi:Domain of unknown function (DUF4124)
MKQAWVLLLALAFAGAAQAQSYKWVDKDGKTRYGDTPPPGVKATSLKGPASPGPAPAVPGAASKDAKKGPLTPAEQEQEYRKRTEAAAKDQQKADQERQAKADNAAECARTRESLRTLQSGQRITRTNAAGEIYYIDDSQLAQEISQAQQTISKFCSN